MLDFTAMTNFDSTTIVAGLVAIGGILAGIKWGKTGVRSVLSLIGRA